MRDLVNGRRTVPVPGKVHIIPKFRYLAPTRDQVASKGGS